MADLSRKYATWESEEDRRVLEWHTNGWNDYAIARELRRSKNAIKRRLEEHILPQKSIQSYTPSYTPSYSSSYIAPQIKDMPIQQEKTAVELDADFILTMRDKGMSDEYIKKMFSKRPTTTNLTSTKNDSCFIT